jgi:hypothetical protein
MVARDTYRALTLAGIALTAVLASSARVAADFELRVSFDGGSTFAAPISDGGSGFIDTFVAGFKVHASASDFISSDLSSLQLQVSGQGAAGNYNLVFQASINDIITSPPPQTMTYNFSGSFFPVLSPLTSQMKAWVNNTNSLFGTSAIVANSGSQSAVSGATGFIGFVAGSPYSATVETSLTGVTSRTTSISLNNSQEIDSASGGNETTTPAPAGLMLVLSGLPVACLGAWRSRVAAGNPNGAMGR